MNRRSFIKWAATACVGVHLAMFINIPSLDQPRPCQNHIKALLLEHERLWAAERFKTGFSKIIDEIYEDAAIYG